MKTSLRAVLLPAVLLSLALGCDSNTMDKDLKRQADRATIKLNRAENERDALQAQLAKANADLVKAKAEQDVAQRNFADLRDKNDRLEADLLQSRQRIRELEEAAMSARQGMPTTRKPQP